MPTITLDSPETWTSLAAKVFPNANVDRFTELLSINPEMSVFESLASGTKINIPELSQVAQFAEPELGRIRESVAGFANKAIDQVSGVADTAQGYIEKFQGYAVKATNLITNASSSLPSPLKGYATEAIQEIGKVNGLLDDASIFLGQNFGKAALQQQYESKGVNLVPWLLSTGVEKKVVSVGSDLPISPPLTPTSISNILRG